MIYPRLFAQPEDHHTYDGILFVVFTIAFCWNPFNSIWFSPIYLISSIFFTFPLYNIYLRWKFNKHPQPNRIALFSAYIFNDTKEFLEYLNITSIREINFNHNEYALQLGPDKFIIVANYETWKGFRECIIEIYPESSEDLLFRAKMRTENSFSPYLLEDVFNTSGLPLGRFEKFLKQVYLKSFSKRHFKSYKKARDKNEKAS